MPKSDSAQTLRRDLGLQIAIAVVVGNVIGSGIFAKPGNIAAQDAGFGTIVSVWVLGGVLCLLGALCFAELATMLPRAGGLYVYLREAYGKPVAFLFGWTEVIFGKPASIGALAVMFIGSFSLAAGWQLSPTAEVLIVSALIIALAGVNIVGVIWGGRVQWLSTVVKAGFLVAVAAAPFVLIPFVPESIDLSNYGTRLETQPELTGGTLTVRLGAILLAVMWAYNGWHGITPLAEEVENPQRNIPLALFMGIGILMVLYLSVNVAYHGVLSMEELKTAGKSGAEEMLRKLMGQSGLAVMSVGIMCSTFGAISTNLLQAPRITFAMGRDGVFFKSLGKVHANYRTPVPAILLMAFMSIALLAAVAVAKGRVQEVDTSGFQSELLAKIVKGLQGGTIFDVLTNFVVFSASIFYVLGVLAVIVLRWRQPTAKRPYRTLGYPLTPILFLAVYFWFLSQVYATNPLESRVSLVLIALGVPVFFIYRWSRRAEG